MLWLLLIENLTDHFELIDLSMYFYLKPYLPSTVDRNLWWDFVMATGSSYFFSPIYTMCTYNIFLPSNHTKRKKRRGKKEERKQKKKSQNVRICMLKLHLLTLLVASTNIKEIWRWCWIRMTTRILSNWVFLASILFLDTIYINQQSTWKRAEDFVLDRVWIVQWKMGMFIS